MSYLDIEQISTDGEWKGLLRKHFDYHVEKVRRILQKIASFSKANHVLYKRFKHAGMPIFGSLLPKPPASPPLDEFETFTLVAEGPNPFEDIVTIPYSKDVMKRYEKIIAELQTLLREMTQNRIECLKRNVYGIIPERGREDLFSSHERELMRIKIDDFYHKHPIGDVPTGFNPNANVKAEKIQWYLKEED